ncbi:folate-binding protein YgfZ [Limnohabitans sp. TS-CS-82]|uniref:CAF17-like 4Fe-4S cluster assembly/insertion protein YgfZ n=1 Tax=Limnohabitans sp. TS-CS-82 TaxID=2094193 RepID=UPI000CF2C65D|nr:folate-binding protein YgfZ [Limnohabitans sp. TS-CS-82]PQA82859.1 folate-binding protein YgfZ [Limnohabitans sp. TS-CS-82]
MSTPVFDLATPLSGVSPLPHLGVMRAVGADAASFLHNQLTNDVLLMKAGECRLAAFCNAKGRMQASFVVYKRSAEDVLLICRRDLMAQTIKRLSMFVMRAKAKLSDASDEFQLLGLAGDAVPLLTVEPWQRHAVGAADVLTLYPALGQARALWLAPMDAVAPAGTPLSADLWQVGEVMSGIAWVEQATFEAFVPQMLNYESVDGVNFKKGCYPGQEIVARSQFRGSLKRRAFIVQSTVPMTAGQEVFSSLNATQPCGLVAQAAQHGAVCVAIAELQLAATENSTLHLGAAQGPVLQLLPLPYLLRDDI